MSARPTTARESKLLEAARRRDGDAFSRLVEPHRTELHAHCYRMLGSVHDADDALQDALLRAWRGLARFEGRSSLRTWLYRITTNACIDVISRRPKRVLPIDHAPAAGPGDDLGEPLTESVWIEPYADDLRGSEATSMRSSRCWPTTPPSRCRRFRPGTAARDAIESFLTRFALQDRWRLLPARANGQLAFGCYAWDGEKKSYMGLSLDVLTLDGARATEVTSFVTPYTRGPARERFAADVLPRFGLPTSLD